MKAFTPQEEKDALLLVRLATEGHKSAFDALATKYSDWVIAAAFTVLKNHDDAADAAQEAWVNLWRDCACGVQFADGDSIPGLLWSRGRQAAMKIIRRRQATKRGGRDPGIFTYELLAELHGLHRWKRGHREHDMTERAPADDPLRKMGLVRRLAMELPPEHLAALDAYYFKSESLEALAARLMTSAARAKRILCDGVQILRSLAEQATPAEMEAAA